MSTHDLQLGNDPWDDLEHWCKRRGFELERLQPDQLAEHVEGLLEVEDGVEAVRHRLEAIGAGFQERGMDDLTGHSLVWECLGEAVSSKTSSSSVTAADSGSPVGVDLLREPGVSGPDVPSAPVGVSGLVAVEPSQAMPPVLAGHDTPELREAVHRFYSSVQAMFESWLARRQSPNTRRAYRRDVLDLVEFLGLPTVSLEIDGKTVPTMDPKQSWALLQVTVPQIQAWRDFLHNERNAAPNTLNRRVSSVSGFYKFMREAAAEARLPINVPNPAHSQFISREVQEPVTPTEALSSTRARQLMSLPEGESVLAYRDRAVLKFYLYTGCRIGTGCRLNVEDFVDHDEDPKLNIQEKGRGKSKRALGINARMSVAV